MRHPPTTEPKPMLSLLDLMATQAAAADVLAMLKAKNPADMQAIAKATAHHNKARADVREAFTHRARLLGVTA